DLRTDTEARIQQDKQAAFAELLLKQGKLKDFHGWIDKHPGLINDPTIPYAEEGFNYILAVDPREDTLEKLQKNAAPKTKESIMNAAEKLIQQGMQKGIQQGMQKEKLGIAKNMLLNLHLGLDVVQKATGLSREELNKLPTKSIGLAFKLAG
ncbi:MAG: hypothetical protein MI674_06640, partial [Cytophagales bacterium]|nr:hypothetical protein [Cytophagales bacterium]